MARWQDVAEADRARKIAIRERDAALADLDKLMEFVRETGQVETYMQWYAKRLGLWETLYAEPAPFSNRAPQEPGK